MFRTYNQQDKPQLLQLIRLNTPHYFDSSEEALFAAYLNEKVEDYFVLEDGEQVLGCGGLNYEENGTAAIMAWGMIHPDHHGKGLGTTLVKHRLGVLKQKPLVNKCVVRTSQHTYRFYEKMGFVVKHTQKAFWGPALDLYHMEMEI